MRYHRSQKLLVTIATLACFAQAWRKQALDIE